ncbi:hypothetical protein Tco_1498208 [Tanacetum coccineum]
MYIMTSRPWTHVSVQAPFGGVTDWYQNQGYREQAMAAPIISISSNVSVESVESSFSRVILIGSISVEVLVAPEVREAAVALPSGCSSLILIHHDSELDTEMPERHVSPTTYTPEIPTAPILPAPSAIVAPSTNIILSVDAPPGIHRR